MSALEEASTVRFVASSSRASRSPLEDASSVTVPARPARIASPLDETRASNESASMPLACRSDERATLADCSAGAGHPDSVGGHAFAIHLDGLTVICPLHGNILEPATAITQALARNHQRISVIFQIKIAGNRHLFLQRSGLCLRRLYK